MARYIFITGGVASSLGKGVAAASLGALLQARGYRVRLRKLDPYLNIDPGTMSPFQHGECFVTDDGTEADLDLGHYERFTGNPARNSDNVTTGRIYRDIIARERRGDFLGATVQVIPHVTDAIKSFICDNNSDVDFVLCEIGGTVGDIEGLPFFEAIRQLGIDLPRGSTAYIHLTLMPYIASAGEMKTKPTQHSVKELRSIGIQPDILMVRCEQEIPDDLRRKLSLFCNVPKSAVIPAIDVDSIYKVPVAYSNAGLDEEVLKVFKLEQEGRADLRRWEDIAKRLSHPEGQVTIGIVGKYTGLKDAYKSLIEALIHGGIAHNVEVQIKWINSELFDNNDDPAPFLTDVQGILIPGGFGQRGSLGKISAIRFARERAIPFLGICFGMQMAVVEIARNVLGLSQANSTEFGPCEEPVIGLLREWETGSQRQERSEDSDLGGTMRLGSFPAQLKQGSLIHQIYGRTEIHERHRHRYEVNIGYRDQLRAGGLEFSGMSPDGRLPEIIEFSRNHPWFVGVQFHPELKSRPFEPHPLFASFVSAAIRHGRLV